MTSLNELQTFWNEIKETAIQNYLTYLRFASISASPDHKNELIQCSEWLSKLLKEGGLDVQVWPSKGNPAIFASYLKAGKDKPTVLFYGHYDVQPVDPLEEWQTPPFEPTIKGDIVYARGAQDNKGQSLPLSMAILTLLKKRGSLPINVKILIEGEEEIGSPNLAEVLHKHAKELQADSVVIVDAGMKDSKTPSVTLGARGLCTMDVLVQGTTGDLHSGSHGGIAFNPIHALVELFASVRDKESGRITIPGFYDDIIELTPKEREAINFEMNLEEYVKMFGTAPTGGEKGISPQERGWLRPTFEVNGINAGYSGPGFKTVIPAKAIAKVSCRLVPGQNPDKVGLLVKNYLEKKAPPGVKVTVTLHEGKGLAVRASPLSHAAQSFAKAYKELFKTSCSFGYCGGSIPITYELAKVSGGEPVFVGLGLDDDNIHAPNEHFNLSRIEKGFLSIARAIDILGE